MIKDVEQLLYKEKLDSFRFFNLKKGQYEKEQKISGVMRVTSGAE